MVTEGDCSCTDTTEPSNVTSLHSDDVNPVKKPDTNLYVKTNNKGNDAAEEAKGMHFLNISKLSTSYPTSAFLIWI